MFEGIKRRKLIKGGSKDFNRSAGKQKTRCVNVYEYMRNRRLAV